MRPAAHLWCALCFSCYSPLTLISIYYHESPTHSVHFSFSSIFLFFPFPPSAAIVHRADRPKPGLVRGCGQRWPVWRGPLERESDTGAFPVRCGDRQRLHLLLPQLRDDSTGQNHAGEPRATAHPSKGETTNFLRQAPEKNKSFTKPYGVSAWLMS